MKRTWILYLLLMVAATSRAGEAANDGSEFLNFIKQQARDLRSGDRVPSSQEAWVEQRKQLRNHLEAAWGTFPAEPCPLEPKLLEILRRDGYQVEKWIFQTFPGVWMTANCYVPDTPGRHPAILAVHGHWRGAKQDPVPQQRCIGPAKLGYVVLAVDAFGAGERGLGKALGEYHGEMVAATLFPVGLPLSGLQVYENMRAVDFLQSRADVDPHRIGITGASGGGNQTMYAGAWDDRFGAVVPVCSVGNYQAYLGNACCMCEVVPGALRFTEESAVLAMTAPRGLMVVNATKDAFQFSVGEARKSLATTSQIYDLFGAPTHLRHAVFDWHHDYSQAMRETMYGWMNRHLRGAPSDASIADPEIKTEDPETLRCFPGETRPDDWMTIPRFAAREARKLLAGRLPLQEAEAATREFEARRLALQAVLGDLPKPSDLDLKIIVDPQHKSRKILFNPEPGIRLSAEQLLPGDGEQIAIVLDCAGAASAAVHPVCSQFTAAGWSTVTLDLRATGRLAWKADAIGRAPDHNSAEWSLWIGRPLAGQWVVDLKRLLDALAAVSAKPIREIAVVGVGPAGLVALAASALDPRITCVITVDSLASYVTDVPYEGQRLAIMVPRMLPEVGDIAHLAALSSARQLVIAGGVWGSGTPLTSEERTAVFQFTREARRSNPQALRLMESDQLPQLIASGLGDN